MSELLDPKNDLVFKKQFVNCPDLLADLINVVRSDEAPIEIIDILNPQIQPEDLSGKLIVLDVLARDTQGRLFNIEMQVRGVAAWVERSLYYLASAYVEQLKRGEHYVTLKPAIGINLLDFDLFEGEQAHWRFRLRDGKQPDVTLDALQLHILGLRKLDRQGGMAADTGALVDLADSGKLRDWVAYFKHWREEHIMNEIHHPPVRKALEELKRLSRDEETWWQARTRDWALHAEAHLLGSARQEGLAAGREAGRVEGREEGLEEGRTEGIQIGEGQGRAAMLARQLQLKFGALPAAVQQHLQEASTEQLDVWAERILFADKLDAVFQ